MSETQQQDTEMDGLVRRLEATGDFRVLRRLMPRQPTPMPAGYTGRVGIILDLETTGLDATKDEVIEIAMVKFRYSDSDEITSVVETFHAFNQPSNPIPAEITELTGITNDMVAYHKVDAAAIEAFVADADIVIAHNAGFDRRFPWLVLDAAAYGVPQHRQRLILMGAKKGDPLPEYPAELFCAADRERTLLPVGPTCADALGDLPNAEDYEALVHGDAVISKKWKRPSAYARVLRGLSNDSWHFGHPRKWNPAELTSSWRTGHSAISVRRFTRTKNGAVEPISRFLRLAADGLSNTLRAGTDGARGAFTSPRPIHYKYPRCVTVREMARLHGFPDWFRFHATKWHGARQIGNAVPPPLARAVAAQVVSALGVTPSRPRKAVHLDDPAFLTMDLSDAARHRGVDTPSSKRDRKSGARKRSQKETEAARIMALRSAHV